MSLPNDVRPRGSRMTHYRWMVCGLLFFATTVNYVDRQVFGILGPDLTEEYHWSERDFSFIVSAFTLAYAIGYTAAGRMMDRIGERRGFTVAVGVWSLAAMAHGLVGPLVEHGGPWLDAVLAGTFVGTLTPAVLAVAGFSVARFALGLAEGGNFPGAIKTVGLWHPKGERALSTGIFNSGSNVGIIVAAYAVPFVVKHMDWGVTVHTLGSSEGAGWQAR
jgi:ACS family hexuronate transporter-like MFS transporter